MCLAIPAEVVALDRDSDKATVSLAGVKKSVSTTLLDDVSVGDFVLVHVGYALHRLGSEEADRTLRLMEEAGILAEERRENSA